MADRRATPPVEEAPRMVDLSDERRAAKSWLPEDDRDVTSGLVVLGPDGRPACARHGAMNRVDAHRRIYRCSEFRCGVGAEIVGGGSVVAGCSHGTAARPVSGDTEGLRDETDVSNAVRRALVEHVPDPMRRFLAADAVLAVVQPLLDQAAKDRAEEQAAVRDDLVAILAALGIGDHARPYSSHEVVQREILPAIRRYRAAVEAVERVCDEAERDADTYKSACIVTTGKVRTALASTTERGGEE